MVPEQDLIEAKFDLFMCAQFGPNWRSASEKVTDNKVIRTAMRRAFEAGWAR